MRVSLLLSLVFFFSVALHAEEEFPRFFKELPLVDGRTLHEVKVLNLSSQALVARWRGGQGTILYRDLPVQLRAQAAALAEGEAEYRERRNSERKQDRREAFLEAKGSANLSTHKRPNASWETPVPRLQLKGQAFVSGGHTADDQVIFSGMEITAYPLREGLWALETNLRTVDWPEALGRTVTDGQGRWSLSLPKGVPYLLYAKGRHYATRTGLGSDWEGRVSSEAIRDREQVLLTDQNAVKVYRVWLNDPRRDRGWWPKRRW